ncbi:MAG: GntR family transcriptional regulator [Thermomicrobiales bacterium]
MLTAQHQTLNLRVYNDIVRLIASGRYPVGARLDEQQIAEELGVSRTPLREAISKLVKDGLVVHRPYKGNFIRQFAAKEVFDLYEVRKGLELMAVRLAIPHCTTDSISHLRSVLEEIEAALETSNLESYGLADERFHDAIAQLSQNQTLISMLARLSGQIQLVRNMANQDPSVVEITAMERPGIVEAMAAGDVTMAMHLMEEHIELVQRNMTRRIEAAQGILSIEAECAFPK